MDDGDEDGVILVVLLGEGVLTLLDLFKQPDQQLLIEGKSAEQDAVECNPQRPHITLPSVVSFRKDLTQHLWSHEVIGPLTAAQSLLSIFQLDCPAEVDQLHVHLSI